ncbi:MAG: MlaD family protein [Holophagales bacterium]|jgi:phospholipid/cholesterol/gamma-HCH transport system substrate-binding protein|nr:MlaD family protein [Holophagales bacterium]
MKQETKVGIFFVVTIFIIGWLIFKTEKLIFFDKAPKRIFTTNFDQAAGLPKQGKVRIAGVEVGKVLGIQLAGNKAVVTFSVDESVAVHRDAIVSLANIGILGEKYIDLNPGHPEKGTATMGMQLASITTIGLDSIIENIGAIAIDLKGITYALHESIGGENGRMKLDEIMDNLQMLTAEFRAVTQENHGAINRTMANIEGITSDFRERLPVLARQFGELGDRLNALIKENGPELSGLASDARKLAQGFQSTSDNLRSITDKLNRGEGTIGKLLTDETTITKLNEAVSGLTEVFGGIGNMEVRLDMGAASWANRGSGNSGKAGLGIEIARKNDYWYSFEFSSSPDGKVTNKTNYITWTNPETGEHILVPANYHSVNVEQGFNFSAEFNKRIGKNFVLHGGIIDGTGGGGIEYRAFKDRFRLGALFYDFTQREGKENPRSRATASYEFWKGLYAQAGIQDIANKDTRSFFFGGGFRWKDDDIKKMVGLVGMAK